MFIVKVECKPFVPCGGTKDEVRAGSPARRGFIFMLVMAWRSWAMPSASGSAYWCSSEGVICALQCTPGWFLKRRLWMARALMTLSLIAALGSPGALLDIWSKLTGCTSTCRSILSNSGPEILPM